MLLIMQDVVLIVQKYESYIKFCIFGVDFKKVIGY